MLLQDQSQIPQDTVSENDGKHDPDPLSDLVVRPGILVCAKDGGATNLALGSQITWIHALVARG